MSAAAVLLSLAAAGAQLAAEAQGLRVRAPGRLPGELLAATRAAKPALLRVVSGAWRLDLATWPDWRREAFEERAAIREHDGGQGRELAEWCAFLEAADLPEPAALGALLEQPVDLAAGPAADLAQLARLEAPGPELPPDVDPADPAALGALGAELPAARSSDPATSATSAELPAGQVEPPVDLEAAALPSPAVVSDYPEVPSNTRARGLAAASVDGADPQQAQGNTRARASRTGPLASGKAAARHHPDTPQAWAAFLDEAPWLGPAERARILADAGRLRAEAGA